MGHRLVAMVARGIEPTAEAAWEAFKQIARADNHGIAAEDLVIGRLALW